MPHILRLGTYFKLILILIQLINKLCHLVLFHHKSVSSHVLGTLLIKFVEIGLIRPEVALCGRLGVKQQIIIIII